jgi:hypothetical protein
MEKGEGNQLLESIISLCIQKTEADVMIMNDWSLDLSNGSDIINMILKLSNEDYDFSRLMAKVNQEAIK